MIIMIKNVLLVGWDGCYFCNKINFVSFCITMDHDKLKHYFPIQTLFSYELLMVTTLDLKIF